jgi:acetylornithine deacetylase/succinyl-diaminopimelate desuccinylase-like protein
VENKLDNRNMTHLQSAIAYAHERSTIFLQELIGFCSIPSISTDPTQKDEIRSTATWVADKLRSLRFEKVALHDTQGHPIVYGEFNSPKTNAPTVLVYGHYDVQPAEPLDKWTSDPFEPEVRGDYIFARGVSDMKGQVAVMFDAIESVIQNGECPVNFKFLIEGEEEIGSPNLPAFIQANTALLACDFALNLDTGMIAPDLPTITYALRGLAYFEVRLWGPRQDLHSGVFGGTVHNPAQALAELIAGMHDRNGTITLPGFYDRVKPLEQDERTELSRLPKNEAWYLENTGVAALWGESEYSPDERVGARPTLEVNGLLSGYTGEGGKTVLPAYAMAKISSRLVPDQDPDEVHQQFLQYCKKNIPPSIQWEVIKMGGSPPSMSNRHSPWIHAFVEAAQVVWGVRPAFKREGGSVPVVSYFQHILGVDTVNTGFGLPTDNMHGPDERLHLPTWYKGIDAIIHFIFNVGNL